MKKHRTTRAVLSWSLYDFANSAFATTVMAGFFPIFFKDYWSHGTDSVLTTARLGTLISISSFLVAAVSPSLGAIADLRANKKGLTFVFMLMGVLSCLGLALVPAGQWQMAAVLYAIGLMGFTSSCTSYDSLLPSIAPGNESVFVSSLGFSLGYLGGGLLFAVNVLMYLKPSLFGLADGVAAIKWSFASVGLWWFAFSIPLFRNVAEPKIENAPISLAKAIRLSGKQVAQTLKEIRANKNLFIFMIAYWFYIDGVFTIINMAIDFGISLGFQASDLIAALLIVQFIGFPCAYLFAKLSHRFGSKIPILLCLVVYALALIGAINMSLPWHFYALAAVIGMVQGGVQALSRALFSEMCPVEKSGEYFGFFNLVGKFASILGPLVVGLGTALFQSHKLGLLGNLILLLIGGVLLLKVQEPKRQAHVP